MSPHQRLIILSFVVFQGNNAVCSAFRLQEMRALSLRMTQLLPSSCCVYRVLHKMALDQSTVNAEH